MSGALQLAVLSSASLSAATSNLAINDALLASSSSGSNTGPANGDQDVSGIPSLWSINMMYFVRWQLLCFERS